MDKNKITSIQALTAALGSCIGNGNIIGVVTAVMFGDQEHYFGCG